MRLTRKVNDEELKEAREIGEPFVREYQEGDFCELEGTWGRDRLNKLGQLEDIEEELGIDLIALFKILKTKECYSKEDGECLVMGINKNGVILMPKKFPFGECEFTAPFAELGKTWALTKEDFLIMAKKGLKHMEI